jgi:threonine aldolase
MGAAGLVALDYLPRLPEDHAKAKALAAGLRGFGFAAPEPETNILLVPVPDTAKAMAVLEGIGVRVLPVGASLRFITHRDLGEGDIAEALGRVEGVASGILAA